MKTKLYNIDTLIVAEYNPRKLSHNQREHIRLSLQEFGCVQPVVVNTHPDRKNIIIGGHQRVIIAKEDLQWKTIPCYEVSLPLEKERELNIRLNKNQGDWDWDKLDEFFTPDELMQFGFESFNFGLHNETIPVPGTATAAGSSTHVEFDAALGDREERVVFECFMLPADRKQLTSVLQTIKQTCSYEKTDQALMHLVKHYQESQ